MYDKVRIGGLMHCCINTLDMLYPEGPAAVAHEGQQLQCFYVDSPDHRLIFRDGAWEWAKNNQE